jgi:NhaA family Na+:H+ antiporter
MFMATSVSSRSPGASSSPPEAWEPLLRLARLARRPLERFLQIEAASGILLLGAAAVALVWSNSAWAASYLALWQTPLGIRIGTFHFDRSLEWVVNDCLMAIFFFVVGLEIRREVHHGELSEWRRAMLPAAAALGGMLAPAGLYLLFAGGALTRSGWGVPMATDIAFALGILALLGKRVPPALRVLLLALAIIDDLGAIVVIAVFYSSGIAGYGLAIAAAGLAGIFLLQRLGARAWTAYVVPASIVWGGIYAAGIHPTIAGVMVGLMTPVQAWLGPQALTVALREELDDLAKRSPSTRDLDTTRKHADVARREAVSPAEGLIAALHPWVAFGIMPVFALANAGVVLRGGSNEPSAGTVTTAVVLGLVLGKPVGVLGASWLATRLGLGVLPPGIGARQLVVLGAVAGVGFTMALFISQLAFTDAAMLGAAKLGVLVASGIAALLALVLGRVLLEVTPPSEEQSADEIECSRP